MFIIKLLPNSKTRIVPRLDAIIIIFKNEKIEKKEHNIIKNISKNLSKTQIIYIYLYIKGYN